MILMINHLVEPEPIEVGGIMLGDHGIEVCVYAALIEVPIYDDENLYLAPCARADNAREEARPSG
jgi:hypothetical protein